METTCITRLTFNDESTIFECWVWLTRIPGKWKECRKESWVVFVLSVTVRCLHLHGSAGRRCPPGQRELLHLQEDGGNASNMIWYEYSTPHTTRKPPSTLPASWLRGGGGRRRGRGGGWRREKEGVDILGCLAMALIYRKTTGIFPVSSCAELWNQN